MRPRWLLVSLVLVAWMLYLWDIGSLKVYGDGGHSIYMATREPWAMMRFTAQDTHPPLYYLVLHLWLKFAGVSELSARWPSMAAILLCIPLTYCLGRRTLGAWPAALGALLVASSPFLLYYARHPRDYSGLVCFGLLSSYFFLRVLDQKGRALNHWLAYAGFSLAAILTHYCAVLVLAAHVSYLLIFRRFRDAAPKALLAWVAVGVASAPWLVYAFGSSTQTVARTTPHPTDFPNPAASIWHYFNFGAFVPPSPAQALSMLFAAIWGIGLLSALLKHRPIGQGATRASFIILSLAIGVLGIWLLAATQNMFHPRYLIFALPFYLLLLGWAMAQPWQPLAAVCLLAALVGQGYGVLKTCEVSRNTFDGDNIAVVEHLLPRLVAGDIVLFHAEWQSGYLLAHHRSSLSAIYGLGEIEGSAAIGERLQGANRIWLAMYERDPGDTAVGRWLAQNAFRADDVWFDRTILYLYSGPKEPLVKEAQITFANGVELFGYGYGPSEVHRGDVLCVLLRWRGLSPNLERKTLFLHLEAMAGQGGVARDGEPADGSKPLHTWPVGEVVVDRRGLLVPPELPSGEYRLVIGWYSPQDGARILTSAGSDGVVLGTIALVE